MPPPLKTLRFRFRFQDLWLWRGRVLGVLLGVALLAWGIHAVGLRELMHTVIASLRDAGAPLFFTAMALLPAVGFPILPFTLAAGPVFGPTLGVGGVIACSVLAVAVNVTLTYLLASTLLRSLLEKLMARLGYRLPDPRRDNAWGFIAFVRLAPGLPFCVQSYLLGLMRLRFGPYLVVSTLVPAMYITGTVLAGDALVHGDKQRALGAAAVVALIVVAVFLIRRRMTPHAP